MGEYNLIPDGENAREKFIFMMIDNLRELLSRFYVINLLPQFVFTGY
jgi:hypothetical protein